MAPGTPLDEALSRLSAAGLGAFGVALSPIYFEHGPGNSGWLDDTASTGTAYKAAMRFVGKTDADAETVFRRVVDNYTHTRHRIETGRENQRRKEAEFRARNPEVSDGSDTEETG